jgi:protein-arginine kinase activator protein McsA
MAYLLVTRGRKSVLESSLLCKECVHKFGNAGASERKMFSNCYEFNEYVVLNVNTGIY